MLLTIRIDLIPYRNVLLNYLFARVLLNKSYTISSNGNDEFCIFTH